MARNWDFEREGEKEGEGGRGELRRQRDNAIDESL